MNDFDSQMWVALAPIFATFTAGLTVGISAVMLPELELEDSEIKITKSDLSWIASFAVLPMAPGCLLGKTFESEFFLQFNFFVYFRGILNGEIWEEKVFGNPLCPGFFWMVGSYNCE